MRWTLVSFSKRTRLSQARQTRKKKKTFHSQEFVVATKLCRCMAIIFSSSTKFAIHMHDVLEEFWYAQRIDRDQGRLDRWIVA